MKYLYLLRHAKSSWSNSHLEDWERPLNSRGQNAIPIMAKKLQPYDIQPDIILSSDSIRTKETILSLVELLKIDVSKITFSNQLYNADLEIVLQKIMSYKQVEALMIVGHNPYITELANYFSTSTFFNIPTCACVGLEFVSDAGKRLEKHSANRIFYQYPKENM